MKSLIAACLFPILLLPSHVTADECQPHTWGNNIRRRDESTSQPARASVTPSIPAPEPEDIKAGDIVCRSWAPTYDDVNYYTCTEMAETYDLTLERFFFLNAEVDADCENIRPNTEYCIDGFVEPLRAYDGFCGPKHNNATCIGTEHGACCNSETGTCGESDEDCSPGICYEGDCYGHDIFTTDGKCGIEHGLRQCAGKWGDCCSVDGECGTGEDYCGLETCQMGNCTAFAEAPVFDNVPDMDFSVES